MGMGEAWRFNFSFLMKIACNKVYLYIIFVIFCDLDLLLFAFILHIKSLRHMKREREGGWRYKRKYFIVLLKLVCNF